MRRLVFPLLAIGVLPCLLGLPLAPMADGKVAHTAMASPIVAAQEAPSPGMEAMAPMAGRPACCSFEAPPPLSQPLVLGVAAALVGLALLRPWAALAPHRAWQRPHPPPLLAPSRRRALLQTYLI